MYLVSRTVSRDDGRHHAKLAREVKNFVGFSPFGLKEKLQSSPWTRRRLPLEDYYNFEHKYCTSGLLGCGPSIWMRSVWRCEMTIVRLYGLKFEDGFWTVWQETENLLWEKPFREFVDFFDPLSAFHFTSLYRQNFERFSSFRRFPYASECNDFGISSLFLSCWANPGILLMGQGHRTASKMYRTVPRGVKRISSRTVLGFGSYGSGGFGFLVLLIYSTQGAIPRYISRILFIIGDAQVY